MARILIVDDEDDVRGTLVAALKGLRHDISEASDGNEALDLLSRQPFDVVVTDILMPNREGLEIIHEIRVNWPDVRIIAMSGGGRVRSPDFLKVAEKFGAHSVLKKPFSMSELKHAVGQILDAPLWQGG